MRANTTVSVQRGQRIVDELGDEETVPRVIYVKIPAFIMQNPVRRQRYDVAAQDFDSTCKTPHYAQIELGDRLVDERSGETYLVRGKQYMHTIGKELHLDLERISGAARNTY